MQKQFTDISIIGLDRIYNGKPKNVNLINPLNYDLKVSYFDDTNELITEPIQVGSYTVLVEYENIKIKKVMKIKNKDDVDINTLLGESINYESDINLIREEDLEKQEAEQEEEQEQEQQEEEDYESLSDYESSADEKKEEILNSILSNTTNIENLTQAIKKDATYLDTLYDNVNYYTSDIKKKPKIWAGLGVLAYALLRR